MIHAYPCAQDATRVPLRLSDLVREVDREPRIPDLMLGERLGFAKPHNVRKLITRNRDELELHGALVERSGTFLRGGENPKVGVSSVLRTPAAARNRGGRPGTMWFLNEGQALVICALARTPIAIKVRQDVIAVYMAHRRGPDWQQTFERERAAVRLLIRNGHVIRADVPQPCTGTRTGFVKHLFVSPVTAAVLDTLAAFEADDTHEGEDERDVEITDDPHDDEGDREPSLGWPSETGSDSNMLNQLPTALRLGGRSDREHDHDTDEGDAERGTVDDEPTLGWPERVGQLALGEGLAESGDYSHPENAGAGWRPGFMSRPLAPDDAEPSLGSGNPDWNDQRHWATSGTDDDREAGDDNGIADDGGVQEASHGTEGNGEFLGGTMYGADAKETDAGCAWEGRTGERA